MARSKLSPVIKLKAPPSRSNLKVSPTQVTLGDLHSNAIKLVHSLVCYGICEFDQQPFEELLALYTKKNPTEADKKAFIQHIKTSLKVKDCKILLRLIGDIVADRGKNDVYVLAILDVLKEQGVPISTLVSNHDVELILAYERYKKNGGKFELDKVRTSPVKSLEALEASVGEGKAISFAEFERLMEKVYLPTLKLVDYSLSSTVPKHITIFSHAPIDLEVIQHMANKFGVTYKASTVDALASTIDAINRRFSNYVRDGNFNLIYDGEKIPSNYFVPKKACVECAIWNRNEDLNAGSDTLDAADVTFVYGHTEEDYHTRENVVCIDNLAGKGGLQPEIDPVFISDEPHSPANHMKLKPSAYLSEQVLTECQVIWGEEKQSLLSKISDNKAALKVADSFTKERLNTENAALIIRINAYNALLVLDKASSSKGELNDLNQLLLVARAGVKKKVSEEANEDFVNVIKDALSVLKSYSAGSEIRKSIECIEQDLEKKAFKQAEETLSMLAQGSFEGLGKKGVNAEERGILQKAWYTVISGIRFFLGLIMSIFTQDSEYGNKFAKSLIGRSFFFQKPKTKFEKALIQEQLDALESAKEKLNGAIDAGNVLNM
ncbi:MAG: hypothetical protein P1U32_01190 [Legionellaceae bacterium]|nr:hypothetical protein [Legionellaceae bacterium]